MIWPMLTARTGGDAIVSDDDGPGRDDVTDRAGGGDETGIGLGTVITITSLLSGDESS